MTRADLRQRQIVRPFRNEVDAAAHATVGRHAVEKGIGALQHLRAFGHFHRHRIGGQHPVQAAEGDIAVDDPQTAHGELVEAPGTWIDVAHRRFVDHHVGHAARLLVLHGLLRVVGDVERRIHDALVAEQTKLPTARDLPARMGLGQGARRVGTRRHPHHRQGRLRFPGRVGRLRCAWRHGHQSIARRRLANGIAAAAQQCTEPLHHTVAALEPWAAQALHLAGVHHDGHARLLGEAAQRLGQWPGGNVITDGLRLRGLGKNHAHRQHRTEGGAGGKVHGQRQRAQAGAMPRTAGVGGSRRRGERGGAWHGDGFLFR